MIRNQDLYLRIGRTQVPPGVNLPKRTDQPRVRFRKASEKSTEKKEQQSSRPYRSSHIARTVALYEPNVFVNKSPVSGR